MPFTGTHLDAAAALLAARQRADRLREPDLPSRYEDPATACAAIEAVLSQPMTEGVVALDGGRLAGYLAGSIVLPAPTSGQALFVAPRAVQVTEPGCAAEPDGAVETYRALYAALAPRWLAAGCFAHSVIVRRCDEQAMEAWSSLGFAREMVNGLHDLAPVPGEEGTSSVAIAQAGPEDLDVVHGLATANLRYHTGSPVFSPYFPETEPELRARLGELLAEPERAPVWLAERDGRSVGLLNLVTPRERLSTPERAIHLMHGYTEPEARGSGVAGALLATAFRWARDAGYARCTINWHTANLLGGRFWQRSGFRPLTYGLTRTVDARIAWAGSENAPES
jgi:GNAT superfamily N-acetyltransferase